MKASTLVDQQQNQDVFDLSMKKTKSWVKELHDSDEAIVKSLLKQLKTKNIKVKVAVMKTFSVLAMVLQDKLEKYLPQIIPNIEQSIHENNNDLLTFSLSILQYTFRISESGGYSKTAQTSCELISKILTQALNHS